MRRTYLIDSENINDVWVELLQVLEDEDEILVFYTDKSAHMGYDRIVCLMEQKRGTVHWIKCFEGQNALDFQLVTELGSCLSRNGSREYIIVSNDTGYDAVVRYWQQKGCSVRRIKGADCEKGAPAERRQEMLSEKALTEKSGQKASEKIPSEKSGQDVSSEKVPSEKKTPAATSEQAPAEKKGRKAKAKKTGAAANRCAEQVRKETECTERESGEALNKSAASAAESHEEEADKSAASAAESHEEEADKLPASAVESRGEEPEKPASSVKKARRKKSPKAASAEKECGELCEMAVPAENGLEEAEASAEKECMEASEKTVEEDGKEAEESGKELLEVFMKSAETTAEVHSPSKRTERLGKNTVEGLRNGIARNVKLATEAAKSMATKTITSVNNTLKQDKFYQYGQRVPQGLARGISAGKMAPINQTRSMIESVRIMASRTPSLYNDGLNMAYGLANGIYAGRAAVVNAVSYMCTSAVNQARNDLQINSPSKVFEELGGYTAEGFAVGYEKKISEVNSMIRDSIQPPAKNEAKIGAGMICLQNIFRT